MPLIIGAVVNVGINAWQGNIDSFWDGLGYAAIGAAAGALGAGLGTGISAALGGTSTFGAGFAAAFSGSGTLAGAGITGVSSSFFTGAAIGGGAGFGSGLVGGLGNGLVDGKNFNDAFGMGINYGLVGGIAGGLAGGLTGGISAVSNGRRFFDGASVTDETVALNLKRVSGSRHSTCGPATCESIDDSFGGNLTKDDIANWYGGNTESGIGDLTLMKDYTYRTNRLLDIRNGAVPPESIFRALEDKTRIVLSMRHTSGIDHMVGINSITKKTVQKISGRVLTKWIIKVMDPYYGSFQKLNLNSVYKTFYIFNR